MDSDAREREIGYFTRHNAREARLRARRERRMMAAALGILLLLVLAIIVLAFCAGRAP